MVVLALAVTAWIVTFGRLVVMKHYRFSSLDFDMGIHDQSVWLLAHFRGFLTVRGLQVFGHHATLGYLLYVPFSWLGAGVDFLNLSMVVVAALGAVPVFLLTRYRTGNAWIATTLGIVFLLHPALQFFMAELFHPEVMAITPLLCAYYCSVRRRWVWFALWAVLAACWKEDVALAIVVLGLIVALRGDRRIGFITAATALTWFLAWTLGLFPLLDHGKVQSAGLYSDVGGSPSGIARTLFSHPSRITAKLVTPEARDYGWKLFAPFGFVALAAPLTLLIGLPQAVPQPHHQRALDQDDHVPLRRATAGRGHHRIGGRRQLDRPTHHRTVGTRARGRVGRRVRVAHDHRVGAVADRRRVPARRVAADRAGAAGEWTRGPAPRPRRRRGQRQLQPGRATLRTRRDLLLPQPLGDAQLRDRRLATPRSGTRAMAGRRPRRPRSARSCAARPGTRQRALPRRVRPRRLCGRSAHSARLSRRCRSDPGDHRCAGTALRPGRCRCW